VAYAHDAVEVVCIIPRPTQSNQGVIWVTIHVSTVHTPPLLILAIDRELNQQNTNHYTIGFIDFSHSQR
jgi:hypothetical protein